MFLVTTADAFSLLPGVWGILPTLLTTPRTAALLGSRSAPLRSLTSTRRFTCAVSWWCAGTTTTPPAAIKAVSAGPRGMQVLPRRKWMLWLDLSSSGKLRRWTGMPVGLNNLNKHKSLYVTVCLCVTSDTTSSSGTDLSQLCCNSYGEFFFYILCKMGL